MNSIRLLLALAALTLLPGCLALTAVSAVPGVLYEAVANQFFGKEKSFPYSMDSTMAGIQRSLWKMSLDADIVEVQEHGGYGIQFGNGTIDGTITLRKQTTKLTTLYVHVTSSTREESVEDAIIKQIGEELQKSGSHIHFNTRTYNNLRKKPSLSGARIGWYRPGAMLDATGSGIDDWLKVKLPSGKYGYLKGYISREDTVEKLKKIHGTKE